MAEAKFKSTKAKMNTSLILTFEDFTAEIRKDSHFRCGGEFVDNHATNWLCPKYTFTAAVTGLIVQWYSPGNRCHANTWRVCRGSDIYWGETLSSVMAQAHVEEFL